MNKFKLIGLALAAVMVFAIAGCANPEGGDGGDPEGPADPALTGKTIIPSVSIGIRAPAMSAPPITTAAGTGNFTMSAITWSPYTYPFQSDTVYTADVTLTAIDGYTFANRTANNAKINGQKATVSNNTGATVKLSYTFPATLTKTVREMRRVGGTPKITYTHGETLDLTGLSVDLTFSDNSRETVAFENFAKWNITVDPTTSVAFVQHGDTLLRSVHNGRVALCANHGERSADIGTLIVNGKSIDAFSVDPIAAVTYTGSAFTPAVTVKDGGTVLTLGTDYTVAYSDNTNGGTATVTITGTGNYAGTKTLNFTINKAAGANVSAPTAASVAYTSVTLNAVTVSTGQTVEYARNTANNTTGVTWQIGTSFTGLTDGTTYYFFARAAGNTNYNEKVSTGTAITTPIIPFEYIITGSGPSSYTATRDSGTIGTTGSISAVISAIRINANGHPCLIQFGNGSNVLNIDSYVHFDKADGAWGLITLTGKVSGSSSMGTIRISGGVSIDSKADITNTATNSTSGAIYNNNKSANGTVTISGGTLSAAGGAAVFNDSANLITVSGNATLTSSDSYTIYLADVGTGTTARLIISGGTVKNTSTNTNASTVYNLSTGSVTISGGTVSATTGDAVHKGSSGTINITGGTVEATTGYAVFNSSSGGETNISGGTVKATTGYAVYNGTNISGGRVEATTGRAVYHNANSKITVSGNAVVTSGNTTAASGTIEITTNGGALEIAGGTVSNTGAAGNAVYNASTRAVTISGGTVSATTGKAIHNNAAGTITVSGNAEITSGNTTAASGTIYLADSGTAATVRLTVNGGTVKNTGNAGNAVYNASTGAVTISGGTVSATTGKAIHNNLAGKITVSGNALVTSASDAMTQGTIYLANSGTAATARLEITGGTVSSTGATIGMAVYNASTGAITISGGTVSALASAIFNNSTGVINISGGTLSSTAAAGATVINVNNVAVNISGGTISAAGYAVQEGTITLGGSPTITGRIQPSTAGGVNVNGTPAFTPGTKVYTLDYSRYNATSIAVTGGARFINNFALYQTAWKLVTSGSNLVIAAN